MKDNLKAVTLKKQKLQKATFCRSKSSNAWKMWI